MPQEPLDPRECLRLLCAEALLRAHPDLPLFPVSLGLQAVANAFVMLGLLPEPQAEQILADHRQALEAKGFGNVWGVDRGELTVRPGAHGYWQARMAGPAGQREVPVSVAAAGVHCPTSVADVCFEWGEADAGGIAGGIPCDGSGSRCQPSAAARVDAAGHVGDHAHRRRRPPHERNAAFRPSEHRGLAARLPLRHATAVIEGVSAQGELVRIKLYGHPWVMGEYWPMITPCFQVRATDDAGLQHDGVPGNWHGLPGDAGRGSFWLWPPVSPDRTSLRVTVSTLWEAVWAEVGLPR